MQRLRPSPIRTASWGVVKLWPLAVLVLFASGVVTTFFPVPNLVLTGFMEPTNGTAITPTRSHLDRWNTIDAGRFSQRDAHATRYASWASERRLYSGMHQEGEGLDRVTAFLNVDELRFGWPVRCLRRWEWSESDYSANSPVVARRTGTAPRGVFTYEVLWIRLVLAGLTVAAGGRAAIELFRFVRSTRRRRRGRCPGCAHCIRDQATCPECGAPTARADRSKRGASDPNPITVLRGVPGHDGDLAAEAGSEDTTPDSPRFVPPAAP